MRGIEVIGIYLIYILIVYGIVGNSYRRNQCVCDKRKILCIEIIFIAGLSVLLNVIFTNIGIITGSDRLNYIYEFSGARAPDSLGLQWIFSLVHTLGGDIYTVYNITTFITVFLTLYAYKKSKYANEKVILLLLSTQWVFFTFTALKQSYANAFAALAFVKIIEGEKRKDYLWGSFFIVLAILFHSSAIILVPITILIIINKTLSKKSGIISAFVIIGSLFIQKIAVLFAKIINPFLPMVAAKISQYMTDFGASGGDSLAVLKYVAIFVILLWAIVNRNRYINTIEGYTKYEMVTLFAAILLLYSVISYWFVRFIDMLYFPVFVFYVLIDKGTMLSGNRNLIRCIVYGSQFFFTFRWILRIFNIYGGL